METVGMENLIDCSLLGVDRIVVVDADLDEHIIDDSLVLKKEDGIIQIVNEGNKIEVINMIRVSDLKLREDFDRSSVEIHLKQLYKVRNSKPIKYIYNYVQGSHYLFGAKCLDENMNFIIGFCYGFDEILLQNEAEFEALLLKYPKDVHISIVKADEHQQPG